MNPATPPIPAVWRRLVRGFRKLRQEPEWAEFAGKDWADRIMGEEVTDLFHAKQGRSIARWTLTSPDDRRLVVFLKRHYRLPRFSGLLAALLPGVAWSPGLQEWEHLKTAAGFGVPVPRALAAGESFTPRGGLQSFLAVEELQGMLPLHLAIPKASKILEPHAFSLWKRGLAKEMARIVQLLHSKNYFHKDLYFCHFYLRTDDINPTVHDWSGRLHLIDFHRLAHHSVSAPWWRIKDLAQLLYSSEIPGITASDRLRFWRAYGARSRGFLAWAVRGKWQLYRRHNHRRGQA